MRIGKERWLPIWICSGTWNGWSRLANTARPLPCSKSFRIWWHQAKLHRRINWCIWQNTANALLPMLILRICSFCWCPLSKRIAKSWGPIPVRPFCFPWVCLINRIPFFPLDTYNMLLDCMNRLELRFYFEHLCWHGTDDYLLNIIRPSIFPIYSIRPPPFNFNKVKNIMTSFSTF